MCYGKVKKYDNHKAITLKKLTEASLIVKWDSLSAGMASSQNSKKKR